MWPRRAVCQRTRRRPSWRCRWPPGRRSTRSRWSRAAHSASRCACTRALAPSQTAATLSPLAHLHDQLCLLFERLSHLEWMELRMLLLFRFLCTVLRQMMALLLPRSALRALELLRLPLLLIELLSLVSLLLAYILLGSADKVTHYSR